MRLVIDGRRLTAQRTGVGRYLEGLLIEWAETGLPLPRTTVVLHDPSGRKWVPEHPDLAVEIVGSRLPGLLWERFGLGRVLRPGTSSPRVPTNLLLACWEGPSVLVVFDTLQEARPADFGRLVRLRFGRRYRRAARRAGLILVPSEATARDLFRYYGVDGRRVRRDLAGSRAGIRPDRGGCGRGRAGPGGSGIGERPLFPLPRQPLGPAERRGDVECLRVRAIESIRPPPGLRRTRLEGGGGGRDRERATRR